MSTSQGKQTAPENPLTVNMKETGSEARMQSLHFRDQGNTTLRLSVPEPDFHLGYISIKH